MITKIKRDTKRMVCLLGMSALFAVNMQAKAAEISEPALEIGPILQSEMLPFCNLRFQFLQVARQMLK